METQLRIFYDKLQGYFGDLHWWPGESPFEIIVGAILTQNTNWGNVEKAIGNLKDRGLLTPERLHQIHERELAELIRASGYYNVKAKRLKHFLDFLYVEYQNSLKKLFSGQLWHVRERLLKVHGIGEETADSILLYAGQKPIFVVDAYTKRILERHDMIPPAASYQDVQTLFMERLPHDVKLFNQYHALIVNTGKSFCRKSPLCEKCPLGGG